MVATVDGWAPTVSVCCGRKYRETGFEAIIPSVHRYPASVRVGGWRGTFKVPAAHIGATMPEPIRVDSQQPAAAAMPAGDGPVPPAGASVKDVNTWWNSLDQQDRDRLIAEHPPQLGNLNGIPADARDKINTAVMNDDLTRVEDAATRHGVSVDDVLENPALYGLSSRDILRYRNADQTKQGLDHNRGSDPATRGR